MDKVDAIIKNVLAKDQEILVNIFKEITTNYKHETKRQHAIRAAIMKFEQKFPRFMEEFDNQMKKRRELAKNEHSADYETDLRAEFAIPDGLEAIITQLFDRLGESIRFLSKEAEKEFNEQEWFAKEFPRFKVAAKL